MLWRVDIGIIIPGEGRLITESPHALTSKNQNKNIKVMVKIIYLSNMYESLRAKEYFTILKF
jgi:hypothetical protein